MHLGARQLQSGSELLSTIWQRSAKLLVLEASIQFETDRAENAGDAFNATFGFTNNYYSIRTSAADLIALSTVLAVGNCSGPKILLRVGRIDAKEGSPLGVPEPQQDPDTHKKLFAKSGFNTGERIILKKKLQYILLTRTQRT